MKSLRLSNLDRLSSHRRRCRETQSFLTRVRTEDKDLLYFRYYDCRILRVFFPTCTTEQREQFFGPISVFITGSDDPAKMLVFRNGSSSLLISTILVEEFVQAFPSQITRIVPDNRPPP